MLAHEVALNIECEFKAVHFTLYMLKRTFRMTLQNKFK